MASRSISVTPRPISPRPTDSALGKILATPPEWATLRVVVSHGNPLQALAGEPELAEGEAAVIHGDGARWIIVARIRVEDWRDLNLEPRK